MSSVSAADTPSYDVMAIGRLVAVERHPGAWHSRPFRDALQAVWAISSLTGTGRRRGVIEESPRCLTGRKTARIARTGVDSGVGATAFPSDPLRRRGVDL
jgi:hypothetical protein